MIQWFKYVRHSDLFDHLVAGWGWVADLGFVHGEYSSLMLFTGDGDPVMPGRRG